MRRPSIVTTWTQNHGEIAMTLNVPFGSATDKPVAGRQARSGKPAPTVSHGFQRARHPTTGRLLCKFCEDEFTPHDKRQEYCDSACKLAWISFWKTRGPRLAQLMYAYRFKRNRGGLTDLCNEFGDMVETFDRKRRERRDG